MASSNKRINEESDHEDEVMNSRNKTEKTKLSVVEGSH